MKTPTMQDTFFMNVGAVIVVPWENLPSPRPLKGAAFGNAHKFFIAEPLEEGLQIKCVTKEAVLQWEAQQ
jgi:hypothetical protein